jgi:ribosomal RNA assembly protein
MTPQEYNYELKIPKDRVAVLIGTKGEVKRDIETVTKTKLDIDSEEGDVVISGGDALGLFTAREIVEAIGRGFNPDFAKLLLKQDYVLDMISIKDYAGKSKDTALRLKGRVIGKEGKSRKTIEMLTDTHISIYGKTIGIIGGPDGVDNARQAIEALLKGSPHGNVYKSLERKQKEMKQKELLGRKITS